MNILSATYSEKMGSLVNHYHNYHQIMYIVSGQIEITVNDRTYTANSNSLVILSRFEKHSIKVKSSEYKRYVVEISSKLFAPVLVNRPENFSNVVCAEEYTEEIKKIFESIVNECEKKDVFYERILDIELEKLFVYIERLQRNVECKDKRLEIVYSIQKEFEKNYSKKFSLEALSEEYHVSRYHLARLFKKATGSSINKYKTALKIIQAKKLLINTSKSITDIATECGFNSISYFSDRFIKSEGVTPSEYRKLLKI